MANCLRKSAWDTETGEDRSESQPHNLSRGEFFGREIGDKKGSGNGRVGSQKTSAKFYKNEPRLRYELQESVAKTEPNNKSLK